MKKLFLLTAALLLTGCGKSLEEKIIGTWEEKEEINGTTYTLGRFVFLEDGSWEFYSDGEQKAGHTWSIKGKEVHMGYSGTSLVEIYVVEDGKLKFIAAKVGENERKNIDGSRQIVLTKEK